MAGRGADRGFCVHARRAAATGAGPRDRARSADARSAQRHHRRRRRARRAHHDQHGDTVRTGVTAILPHAGNLFQEKVAGAVFVGNAFGKLAGSTQVQELGTIETPIVLTNTLSVGTAMDAVVRWTLGAAGQRERALGQRARRRDQRRRAERHPRTPRHARPRDRGDRRARRPGPVDEGAVGAGTGTVAFGWKGGIGTSSRTVRQGRHTTRGPSASSCRATTAASSSSTACRCGRNSRPARRGGATSAKAEATDDRAAGGRFLHDRRRDRRAARRAEPQRLAARAVFALARTGSTYSNGSGDFAIAFSTHPSLRVTGAAGPADAHGPADRRRVGPVRSRPGRHGRGASTIPCSRRPTSPPTAAPSAPSRSTPLQALLKKYGRWHALTRNGRPSQGVECADSRPFGASPRGGFPMRKSPRGRTVLTLVGALLALQWSLTAQTPVTAKRPLTYDVVDYWKSIQGTRLSDDGQWLAYATSAQSEDGELIVQKRPQRPGIQARARDRPRPSRPTASSWSSRSRSPRRTRRREAAANPRRNGNARGRSAGGTRRTRRARRGRRAPAWGS